VKRPLAELVGTFALVFAGTGAIVIDGVSGGQVTHVGVALTFGLVVTALIYALGDVSGAHMNPAVTLAFVAARRFPARDAPLYVIAQCTGAILASALLHLMFAAHATLGATQATLGATQATLGATFPAGSAAQSFVLELVMTWLLMLVILCVSDGAKERGLMAGIAIGAVVALEALFGGPISGASMNPARSIGPALVSGRIDALWIYIAAPILGAMTAVPMCRWIRAPGCCGADEGACA
jgi:aquaporin Z